MKLAATVEKKDSKNEIVETDGLTCLQTAGCWIEHVDEMHVDLPEKSLDPAELQKTT